MVDYAALPAGASSLDESTLTLLKLTQAKAYKEKKEFLDQLSSKQLDIIVRDLWGGGFSSDVRSYITGMVANYVIPEESEKPLESTGKWVQFCQLLKKEADISSYVARSEEQELLVKDSFGEIWRKNISQRNRILTIELLAMRYIGNEANNPELCKRSPSCEYRKCPRIWCRH